MEYSLASDSPDTRTLPEVHGVCITPHDVMPQFLRFRLILGLTALNV